MTKIVNLGLAPRIIRDDQSYQLVAVIEGAGANAQFVNNLKVIGEQRRVLMDTQQKLAALTGEAPEQERSELQKRHDQLSAKLNENLQFMVKHYGYSLKHNYLLSPVQSVLLLKGKDDAGKPVEDTSKATLVTELRTPEAYEELQFLRNQLGQLAADPEKQEQCDGIREQLKEQFDFDVNEHYILEVRKGALYASTQE